MMYSLLDNSTNPMGKFAEKAVGRSVFNNMALYFECRIYKNALLQTVFFGNFAHWVFKRVSLFIIRHIFGVDNVIDF